jgi:hypothetical protein
MVRLIWPRALRRVLGHSSVERMADGLMRTDPTLTREVAITKAASENPALYREYRAAQAAEAKAAQQEA